MVSSAPYTARQSAGSAREGGSSPPCKQLGLHAVNTKQAQHGSAACLASLIRLSLTGGTEAIVIKPAEDSDAAQAPLAEWPDLALYARGIIERQAAIPPGLLSLPHGLTPLPLEPPPRFVAEPYVATDKWVSSPLVSDSLTGCRAVCSGTVWAAALLGQHMVEVVRSLCPFLVPFVL